MSASEGLRPGEAFILGLLQGPAELFPVSSSAHTSLLPWLAGRPPSALSGPARRELEVALHAGAALALLVGLPAACRRPPLRVLLPAVAIPSAAGYLLEVRIDQHLSGPATMAVGLAAGAAGMLAAQVSAPSPRRGLDRAGWIDGIWLGSAQAVALLPGVSRSGAVLTAARARGFSPVAGETLSWQVGLPVMLAATCLKLARSARRGRRLPGRRLLTGALVSGGSTALSLRALAGRNPTRTLTPYAAYRLLLAGLVARRLRSGESGRV